MPTRSSRPSNYDLSPHSPTCAPSNRNFGIDDMTTYGSWQDDTLDCCQDYTLDYWQTSRNASGLQYEFDYGYGMTPLGTSLDTNSDTVWPPSLSRVPADPYVIYENGDTLDHASPYSCIYGPNMEPLPISASSVGSASGTSISASTTPEAKDIRGSHYGSFEPYATIEERLALSHMSVPDRWDCSESNGLAIPGFSLDQYRTPDFFSGSLESESAQECELSAQSVQKFRQREPGLASSRAHIQKSVCSERNCGKEFSYSADLSRHIRTMHSEAGRGYRCTVEGCNKAYKVWHRLDSFKKHVRTQHQLGGAADVKGVVSKSRTEQHGLPVFVTTPVMIRERVPKPRARPSNPRLRLPEHDHIIRSRGTL
jgi:hypothetical protein